MWTYEWQWSHGNDGWDGPGRNDVVRRYASLLPVNDESAKHGSVSGHDELSKHGTVPGDGGPAERDPDVLLEGSGRLVLRKLPLF